MSSTLGHCPFRKQITPQGYREKVNSFTLDLLELQAQNFLKDGLTTRRFGSFCETL